MGDVGQTVCARCEFSTKWVFCMRLGLCLILLGLSAKVWEFACDFCLNKIDVFLLWTPLMSFEFMLNPTRIKRKAALETKSNSVLNIASAQMDSFNTTTP